MERQPAPSEDRFWWTVPDESYWQALLEQGELAPEAVPPAEPEHHYMELDAAPGEAVSARPAMSEGGDGSGTGDRWQVAQRALERGDLFRLKASGANRGGLLVDWNGLLGFVPASHLKGTPRHAHPEERALELAQRIGDTITVRLIEVDPGQGQLVFSERAAVQDPVSPTSMLRALKPGDVCNGSVTNLTTFGAFVDLGGVEGLIHISEISWERVHHPADVLHLGQDVDVYVLGVKPEEGRIALSLRQLCPDPWSQVESRYQVGEVVQGTVTNVVSFGAFVRLEEGLEGLIHVSELAEGSFLHPRNILHEGDLIQVRVLSVDASRRRLGLSLRQVHSAGAGTTG